MTTKGKPDMDKVMGENEIKGLEEEIDSAVDRLFVEKKGGVPESQLKKPPVKEPSFKIEKDFDLESAIPPAPAEPPVSNSVEALESQLLSLEWEITKENLGKTKKEILALRETLKEKPNITLILGLMEKALDYMIKNEEKIRPPLVKFLLDSKETIKLLMKKETDSEINIYKQLAYVGIQARYSCLEELKEAKPERAAVSLGEERVKAESITKGDKQADEILKKMNLYLERAEEISRKIDQQMSRLEQGVRGLAEPVVKAKPVPLNVTVFKVEDKIFGVESDKVIKLLRVPSASADKYSDQQKIRLKDFEVRLVDLKKIFSIRKGGRKEEIKILTVKEDGEYKGLMIDQVLERLSAQSDIGGTYGEYFLGTFHWTYEERPMEIPILDLKKF
jgi:hypothetical protein